MTNRFDSLDCPGCCMPKIRYAEIRKIVGQGRRKTEGRHRFRASCEAMEEKTLLASFVVTNPGFVNNPCQTPGTLHYIIHQVNASPGPHSIEFSTSMGTTGLVLINGSGIPQINEPVVINAFSFQGQDLGNRNVALAYRQGFNPEDYFCNNPLLGSDGYMLWFNNGAAGSEIRTLSFIRYDYATAGPSLSGVFSSAPITIKDTSSFGTLRLSVAADIMRRITPINNGVMLRGSNGSVIQGNSFIDNQGAGILLTGTTRNTLISGNTIVSNQNGGINAIGSGSSNTFANNSIYLNGSRGIFLGANANGGIKPPIIAAATSNPLIGELKISGIASGLVPNVSYRIEYYTTQRSNAYSSADAQGERRLLVEEIVAGGGGNYFIDKTLRLTGVAIGDQVTATITRLSSSGSVLGSTSEFSEGMTVFREPSSDLSVAIQAPKAPLEVGDTTDYAIFISNYGFDASAGLLLTNTFSPNVVPVAGTIVIDGKVAGSVSIPPGVQQSISIPLLGIPQYSSTIIVLKMQAVDSGEISFTSTATSPTYDPIPGNNSVTIARDAIEPPAATISLSSGIFADDPRLGQAVGATMTYELTISNSGPDVAKSVEAVTLLPAGLQFLSASVTSGTVHFDAATRRVTANLGNVDNESKVFVKFRGVIAGGYAIDSGASTTSTSETPVVPVSTSFAIQDIPGVLRFSKTGYTVTEEPSPHIVEFPVTRQEGSLGDATVTVKAIDGTGVAGVDYELLTPTLTFPNGDRSPQNVQVRILTTSEWFASRTFSLELTDVSGATLGFPDVTNVTILDSQPAPVGTIVFKGGTPNPVSESGGFITVEVERVDGLSKQLAVTLATANGTAIAGTNFGTKGSTAQFSQLVTWSEGEMGSKFVNIPILQDGVFTPSALDFQISVSPANADTTITGLTSESIFIVNTTQTSNVGFNPVNYQVLEDAGSITVTVTRTIVPLANGVIPALTVNFATANGTALAGVDYVAAAGTLNWSAGDTSPKTITIGIIDKPTTELDRNFFVNLSGVSLAVNGTITAGQAQVIVKDTDIDATGPKIGAVQFSGTSSSISQIFLTFSEPLDVASATNGSNYLIRSAGGETSLISGVQYLSSSNSVIVNLPAGSLKPNTFYTLTVNGTAPNGVKDIFGNLLDGAGTNGTNYVTSFMRGTSATYVDDMNNRVTIGLRNGGFFDLTRFPSGQGQWLAIYDVTSRSVLSGSVRRLSASSSGYTRIDTLSGIGNPWFIRVTMTTPPFYVNRVLANNPPLPGGVAPVGSKLAVKKLRTPAPARVVRGR